MSKPTRREVLAGAAGLSAAVLAACSTGAEQAAREAAEQAAHKAAERAGQAGKAPGQAAEPAGLAQTSEIPVNGGRIYPDVRVVVTQPAAGEFKAFSAVCTHKGCTVASVADGVITCGCHNAKYDAESGEVISGPAKQALPVRAITVDKGTIRLS